MQELEPKVEEGRGGIIAAFFFDAVFYIQDRTIYLLEFVILRHDVWKH